jgi:hypothetical protein
MKKKSNNRLLVESSSLYYFSQKIRDSLTKIRHIMYLLRDEI